MPVQIKNNAATTLVTAISGVDTALFVANGAVFPEPGALEYFYATLLSPNNDREIVRVTARVGNTLTVDRAQEGTAAVAFTAGSLVELRVTAQTILDVLSGGPFVDELDANLVKTTNLQVTNLKAKDGTLAGLIADSTGLVTLFSLKMSSGATITSILDEDDMASDSPTALATQQSIKAYVDSQVTAQDLDVVADSGSFSIDLDSQALTVAGGTGLTSSAAGTTLTLAIDSSVATLTGMQTLTSKTLTAPTISGGSIDDAVIGSATPAAATFTTLNASTSLQINTGATVTTILDEDDMVSDSATALATQQSIKAYVDANAGGGGFTVVTTNTTIAAGALIIANSASAFTITLPASPSPGDTVTISNQGTATVTVGRNGENIKSVAADATLLAGSSTQLVYVDASIGWGEL